jgi:protoporphyrinogen oxidase
VSDEQFRGFTFHFKPEVLDQQMRLKRISEVLAVRPEQIDEVVWKSNLLPSLKVGHVDLVEEIDTHLDQNHLLLTGNYFAGVSIEDCVSRSLHEFSRLAVDGDV